MESNLYHFVVMSKGVEGYLQFIAIDNYAKARTAKDPQSYLQALKDGGYATSINYVTNLMNVITKWNLTQYDKSEVSKVAKPTIKSNLTTRNYTKMTNKKNKYIVIHYTASTGSALNNTKYFKSNNE